MVVVSCTNWFACGVDQCVNPAPTPPRVVPPSMLYLVLYLPLCYLPDSSGILMGISTGVCELACEPPSQPDRLMGISTDIEVEKVAPIGNSPTFLTMSGMKQVMPLWLNMSMVKCGLRAGGST